MKLTQIELRRFGRFTDVSYGLAPDAGLHVLYGSNEAGKTTLLDAVTYALHGMPQGASKERAYGFAHPLPTLRVGLKVQRTDGSSLHFLRKRGRTGTVLDPDTDAAAPEVEAQLNGLLAGIGKDEWRLRHGLSQEKLRAGANEMLASGGDAGDALFAAATGITVVRSVLNDVRARRRALLADSGRTGELHVAVQAYETARKQVEQARSASSGYEQQIVRRDQITEERTRITGEHASLQARIERIDAARKVAAELAARAVLTAELGECPEPAIAWTKAEHDDLIETTRALEAATEALRERDLLLTRRTAELAEHIVDERLVAAEDEMTSLLQRIELVRGVRDRQPKLELRLAAAMDALQAAVADLGGLDGIDVSDESQIDIEALRRAIPSLDAREALDVVIADGHELDKELESANTELARADTELQHAARAVEQTGRDDDASVAELEALLETYAKLDVADLHQRVSGAAATSAALEHRAAALPGCELDLARLRSVALPDVGEIERIADELAVLDKKIEAEAGRLENHRLHLDKHRAELTELDAQAAVPDQHQLTKLRGQRDELWHQIRGGVEDATLLDAARAAVPQFEQATDSSDRYADDAIRAGELVGQAASLRTRIRDDETREAASLELLDTHKAEREQLLVEQWVPMWTGAGIEAGSPDAMRRLVEQIEQLRHEARQLDELQASVAASEARIGGAVRELRRALGEPDTDAPADAATFETLLGRAKARRDTAARSHDERTTLRATASAAARVHHEINERVKMIVAAEEGWMLQWFTACDEARIDPHLTRELATRRNERFGQLEHAIRELEAARRARNEASAQIDGFTGTVQSLIASVGDAAADIDGATPELAVAALHKRVAAHVTTAGTRRTLEQQLAELRE